MNIHFIKIIFKKYIFKKTFKKLQHDLFVAKTESGKKCLILSFHKYKYDYIISKLLKRT